MGKAHTEGLVFLVLGPSLLVAGVWWLVWTIRFRRTAARAQGVVIANDKFAGRYGSEYSPQFRFQTPDGRGWTVESNVTTRPPAFRVGEAVTVLYLPEKPEKAQIDSISQLWLLPVSVVIGGIIFCGLAYWSLQ